MLYKSEEVNATSRDVIGSKNKSKLFKVFQSLAKENANRKITADGRVEAKLSIW